MELKQKTEREGSILQKSVWPDDINFGRWLVGFHLR